MSRLRLLALGALLRAQRLLGQPEAALRTLNAQLQLQPANRQARARRAHLRAQLGQAEAALADYAWLTAQPGASAAHWFNQGFVQEAAGQLDAAARSFEQATALDDRLDRAWYGLGQVRQRQGRLEEAAAAFERNTQLQPLSPHGWCALAGVHHQRHDAAAVARIVQHLRGFEPRAAARLAQDTASDSGPGVHNGHTPTPGTTTEHPHADR